MGSAAKLVLVPAAAALAAGALLPRVARAEGGAAEMLRRARMGIPPAEGDRERAADLLGQWRESERVGSRAGDPALGRALEAVLAGRRLVPGERAALGRYEDTRRRSLAAWVERSSAPGASGVRPGGASPRAGAYPAARRSPTPHATALLVAVGAGGVVVAAGLVWMLVARRLGRAAPGPLRKVTRRGRR